MRGGWVTRGTVLCRLSRQHFAFYRGYLDNMDLRKLAQRYLENVESADKCTTAPAQLAHATEDLRLAKAAVAWIGDQLAVYARRAGLAKNIRLLSLPPEKLHITYASSTPTLDEFREERDPYEVYTEDMLIELFQEEYGGRRRDRRAVRNDRLRAKQRTALLQLEELSGADPKPPDRVDGWLDPTLAQHLKAAGLHTLSDLLQTINGYGYRWYTKVPKVGEKAAAQIVKWLTLPEIEQALGKKLHARALNKKRDLQPKVPAVYAPKTAIVPLEHFKLPHELDGSTGSNRGDRPLLSANNDLQAIHAWLGLFNPDGHTWRAYRKEAERFLLWSILEKGKPLSSLSVEDCRDYRDFLWHLGTTVAVPSPARSTGSSTAASPPPAIQTLLYESQYWHSRFRIPQQNWIGKRGSPRWSEMWRPFEGKLSKSSQATAQVIVTSMLQWLTDQHYLHGNPMKGVPPLTKRADKIDTRRSFSKAEWNIVKAHLHSLKRESDENINDREQNDKYYRMRFILALAYSTGMRLSELAALRRSCFTFFVRSEDGVTAWQAEVLGKGGKTRMVQISRPLMEEIQVYFKRRGFASFSHAEPDIPLIAALPLYRIDKASKTKSQVDGTSNDPLSEARLYEILEQFFENVAATVNDIEITKKFKAASTHWLRHTYATHALENGIEAIVVRDLLGHASLDTTSVYLHAERDRSSKQIEEFGPAL